MGTLDFTNGREIPRGGIRGFGCGYPLYMAWFGGVTGLCDDAGTGIVSDDGDDGDDDEDRLFS